MFSDSVNAVGRAYSSLVDQKRRSKLISPAIKQNVSTLSSSNWVKIIVDFDEEIIGTALLLLSSQ